MQEPCLSLRGRLFDGLFRVDKRHTGQVDSGCRSGMPHRSPDELDSFIFGSRQKRWKKYETSKLGIRETGLRTHSPKGVRDSSLSHTPSSITLHIFTHRGFSPLILDLRIPLINVQNCGLSRRYKVLILRVNLDLKASLRTFMTDYPAICIGLGLPGT